MNSALDSILSLIRSLASPAQRSMRLVAILLGIGVLAALLAMFLLARGADYRTLAEGSPAQITSLLAELESLGLEWRSRDLPGGSVRIEVRAGDDYRRALVVASHQGVGGGSSSPPLPVEPGGLFSSVSPSKRKEILDDWNRRNVEDSILFNRRISKVRFMFYRAPAPILSPDSASMTTAAVVLDLKSDVEQLTSAEARAIRDIVSGAYNIPPENIQIVDGHGRRYGPAGAFHEELDTEERVCQRIRDVVEELYLGLYRPWEFRLGVLVDVSSRTSESIKVSYEKEKSLAVPEYTEEEKLGCDAATLVIRSETTYPGWTEETTKTPAGEIEAVRVNLILDIKAVKRVLEERYGLDEERDLEEKVARYEKEQELLLANLIPRPDTQVKVSSQVFSAPEEKPLDVPAEASLAASDLASFSPGWLAAIGGSSFLAAALLLLVASRFRHRRREGPATKEGDASRKQPVPAHLTACEETLELTREAERTVREHPDVAAFILRLWLAETRQETGGEAFDDDLEELAEEPELAASAAPGA